jgi:hypothetical protein
MDEPEIDSSNPARARFSRAAPGVDSARALIYRNRWWRLAGDGTVLVRDAGGVETPMPLADVPLPVTRAFGTVVIQES